MLFAVICTDRPGKGLELRRQNRPDHLAWLQNLGDVLKLAGPFMNDEGDEPRGSLLVIEASDMEEARDIAAGDPYNRAGVFDKVEIRTWKWLIGQPGSKQG